jgi:hypothetical protein
MRWAASASQCEARQGSDADDCDARPGEPSSIAASLGRPALIAATWITPTVTAPPRKSRAAATVAEGRW